MRCTWCWIYTDSVQVNIITQRGADYSKPTNIRKDLITQFKGDNLVNLFLMPSHIHTHFVYDNHTTRIRQEFVCDEKYSQGKGSCKNFSHGN